MATTITDRREEDYKAMAALLRERGLLLCRCSVTAPIYTAGAIR